MPNFFVPARNIQGGRFFFDETESRHLVKVLRKKEGDTLQIFDGDGGVYPARLTDCSNSKKVSGEILEMTVNPERSELDAADSRIHLALYPAALKGPRFDWLIEKATELGVSAICPVTTERTLIQASPADAIAKQNRWQKIALAAAKQCGRAQLPAVDVMSSYKSAIEQVSKNDLNILLWEREKKTVLANLLPVLSKKRSVRINLFTGPEGGYALPEVDLARKAGIQTAMLGHHVLRAETAAIAAISRILF